MIRLKTKPKTDIVANRRIVRFVQWEFKRGEWRSRDVRIIPIDNGVSVTWYIKLRVKGRWVWCYSKYRQWGYGSASQAKLGLSRWKVAYQWDESPEIREKQKARKHRKRRKK